MVKLGCSIVLRVKRSLLRVQHSSVWVQRSLEGCSIPLHHKYFHRLSDFLLYVHPKICDEVTKMLFLKKIQINVAIVSLQNLPF